MEVRVIALIPVGTVPLTKEPQQWGFFAIGSYPLPSVHERLTANTNESNVWVLAIKINNDMKVQITFKDPDALEDCITEALEEVTVEGISADELEAVKEKRREEVRDLCRQWFKWGEYLTVEVDTESKTCAVVANA